MVELRPASRRELAPSDATKTVKIEDVHVDHRNGHSGHGIAEQCLQPDDFNDVSADMRNEEIVTFPVIQMKNDVKVEEEDNFVQPSHHFFGQVNMEIGDQDQPECDDSDMTEALLARETLPADDNHVDLEDLKLECMTDSERFETASEATGSSYNGSTVPNYLEVVKQEPIENWTSGVGNIENDDEFEPSTPFYSPLSSPSKSGSITKWTSSDDLSSLFDSPSETKKAMYHGMTGLNNLGNSCYLNSVVQCLANTRELRDYFLSGSYKREINRRNKMGTKGKFANVMEETFRALWRGTHAIVSPTALRDLMAERNDQFSTYGQQDAQEAMTFIIDSLHEDLNRVTEKPYLSDIESDNRPDEEVAEQAWNYYHSRENSAIYDMFSGMFKSTVECLTCHKKNIKFDPYQFLSIPVPKHGMVIDCFLYPRDTKRKPLRFRMDFNREHSMAYHEPLLQAHLGQIPLSSVKILALRNGVFASVIHQDTEFNQFARFDESVQFHMYEVLTEETEKESVHHFLIQQYLRVTPTFSANAAKMCSYCRKYSEMDLKRCTRCYSVRYCNGDCQKKDWNAHKTTCETSKGPPIGLPFVVSLRARQLTQEAFYMNVGKMALNSVTYWKAAKTGPQSALKSKKIPAEVNSESGDSVLTGAEPGLPLQPSVVEAGDDTETEPAAKKLLLEWKVADSFKAMASSKKNTYPFKLLHLTNDRRGPPVIYPAYNTEMLDAEAVEKVIRLDQGADFLLLWNNAPPDEPFQIEPKDIDYELDPSCRILLNERERARLPHSDRVNLEDCINLLTKPEVLSQSNAWKCPACKVHREAWKKFEIWSLPSVLVFQLKRFSKPSGEPWRRDKIETFVDYPLHTLEMSDCLVGPGDGYPYIYDLYGAVVHRGSTWYGHYVSYARCYNLPDTHNNEMSWRCFDDESVDVERDADHMVNRGAYLLFYRRRGTPSPISPPPPLGMADDDLDGEEDVKGPSNLEQLNSRRLMSLLRYYCTIL